MRPGEKICVPICIILRFRELCYQTYSDSLKNSFFPRTIPHSGTVFLIKWSIRRLLRSLGHSSFSQNTAKRFFLFFCCCFFILFGFFLQNSKFALPGVMIVCDRASRKKRKESTHFCDFEKSPSLRPWSPSFVQQISLIAPGVIAIISLSHVCTISYRITLK